MESALIIRQQDTQQKGQTQMRQEGSFDVKTDWVTCVKDIMQSAYRYGDLKGYMEWKKFLGLLEK